MTDPPTSNDPTPASKRTTLVELQTQLLTLEKRLNTLEAGYTKWAYIGGAVAVALAILFGKTVLELPQTAVKEAETVARAVAEAAAIEEATEVAKAAAREQAVRTVEQFIEPHSITEMENLILAAQKAKKICEGQRDEATLAVVRLNDAISRFEGVRFEGGSLILASGGIDVHGRIRAIHNDEEVLVIDPVGRQLTVGRDINVNASTGAGAKWIVDQAVDTSFQGSVFNNPSRPWPKPNPP